MLLHVVQGQDAVNVPACWLSMVKSIRNLGRPGAVRKPPVRQNLTPRGTSGRGVPRIK
jgi:hypothetical protein